MSIRQSLHATLVFLALVCSTTPAAQPKISTEEAKAYALKLCLDGNYERSGRYMPRDLKDESYRPLQNKRSDWVKGADKRLRAFVESSTLNYYRAQVPMKDEEGRGPFNRIFEQCMGFYRSRALADFVIREL